MRAIMGWLGFGLLAWGCSQPLSTDADDDDAGHATECQFNTLVQPSRTCGSNEGMVCPGTTYCDACDQEVPVQCTCTEEGSNIGARFVCEDCAQYCPGGGQGGAGGAGGGNHLSADEQLCANFCAGNDSLSCPGLSDCRASCMAILAEPTCNSEARAYVSCGASATWECAGDSASPIGCLDLSNAWIACISQ